MIKIYDQLWYIITDDAAASRTEKKLAYMTYYENNSAFASRRATGFNWARSKTNTPADSGVIIDNIPVTGFYIGSSVSRWSTSNKLYRVHDPRGFVVEVPTDNIATLLHHCTVVKGIVQEECVWGREGTNHILLPVNSEPYLETLKKMDIVKNKLIPMSEIKVGDIIKLFNMPDYTYTFAGKIKYTWICTPYHFSGFYKRENLTSFELIDNKASFMFKCQHKGGSVYYTEFPNPKITEIVGFDDQINPLSIQHSNYPPARINTRARKKSTHECTYFVKEWKVE